MSMRHVIALLLLAALPVSTGCVQVTPRNQDALERPRDDNVLLLGRVNVVINGVRMEPEGIRQQVIHLDAAGDEQVYYGVAGPDGVWMIPNLPREGAFALGQTEGPDGDWRVTGSRSPLLFADGRGISYKGKDVGVRGRLFGRVIPVGDMRLEVVGSDVTTRLIMPACRKEGRRITAGVSQMSQLEFLYDRLRRENPGSPWIDLIEAPTVAPAATTPPPQTWRSMRPADSGDDMRGAAVPDLRGADRAPPEADASFGFDVAP